MSHTDFVHLLSSIKALSPDQMRQLRHELDQEIADAEASHAAVIPPLLGPAHKPIWEVFQELSASVPDEVWDALPTDLSEQHDHYIYGTLKRPTA
jgi:hypothetical protein